MFKPCLLVGFITFEGKEDDVEVAHGRCNIRNHHTEIIGDLTLQNRNQRAANDGGTKNTWSRIGEFAEVFGCQREDGREHDGVEKTDGNQRPHGDVGIAFTNHDGNDEQGSDNWGIKGKVAVLYAAGKGVEKSTKQAREWYEKAVKSGSQEASKKLNNLK